jgi:hypothetical protein
MLSPTQAQAEATLHITEYGVDAVVKRPSESQVRGGPVVHTDATVFSLRGILFAAQKPTEAIRAARPKAITFYEFHFEGYASDTPPHLKLSAKDSLTVTSQTNPLGNNLTGTFEIVGVDDGESGGVLLRAWLTKAD